jgi:spore maturation protein CgeB
MTAFAANADQCTGVRVLITGEYWPGANPTYWAKSFERCGAVIRFLDDLKAYPNWGSVTGKVASRLLRRPVIEREWNDQLLAMAHAFQPDVVYVSSGHFCRPETLRELRARKIPTVCMYYDPVWDKSRGGFVDCMPEYDLLLTPRDWQAEAFRRDGAREVFHIRFGCEPTVHRPIEAAPLARDRYGADVSLVSSYRPYRAKLLEHMVAAEVSPSLRIWGGLWEGAPSGASYLRHWQHRTVHEDEMVAIYASSKVGLHFVHREPNSSNASERQGDQHNSRSFQIPSCGGGIMVAPRTDEHCAFFEEDREAVFFDGPEELVDKLKHWLAPERDASRREMAAAARARTLAEDYSYTPLARDVLRHFDLAIA